MAQWGSNDAASNSALFAPAQLKVAPNTTNRDALFGNSTSDAYITGTTIGQYGVDANEVAAQSGAVAHTGWVLRTEGSGGRAGRIQTEVLVAGGITTDAEDTAYPDYTITITTQPVDGTANTTAAEEETFTVVAASNPNTTLTYAWTYANGDAIQAGANVGNTTQSTLTVNSAVETANVSYKVTVSATGADDVISSNAALTITT